MNSDFSDFIRFFLIFRLFPTFRLTDSTGLIWTYTKELNQTSATSVTFHLLGHKVWGSIWTYTKELNQTSAVSVTFS